MSANASCLSLCYQTNILSISNLNLIIKRRACVAYDNGSGRLRNGLQLSRCLNLNIL